jgi:hypothetical protein
MNRKFWERHQGIMECRWTQLRIFDMYTIYVFIPMTNMLSYTNRPTSMTDVDREPQTTILEVGIKEPKKYSKQMTGKGRDLVFSMVKHSSSQKPLN